MQHIPVLVSSSPYRRNSTQRSASLLARPNSMTDHEVCEKSWKGCVLLSLPPALSVVFYLLKHSFGPKLLSHRALPFRVCSDYCAVGDMLARSTAPTPVVTSLTSLLTRITRCAPSGGMGACRSLFLASQPTMLRWMQLVTDILAGHETLRCPASDLSLAPGYVCEGEIQ